MVSRLSGHGERRAQLRFMQWAGQGLFKRLISLFSLQTDCLVEKTAAAQVIDHEVEEVDVPDTHPVLLLRNMIKQSAKEVANPKLVLGRIVEDIECGFVADPGTTQEFIRGDPR